MGRSFFVDSRQGEDENSGLSKENAWKSLERVNRQAFEPGDTICFARDGLWYGMLCPNGNGSVFSPITIRAYGEGERPCVHADDAFAAVLLDGVSGWVIRDLSCTNQAKDRRIRQGICIIGRPQGITGHIRIENCEVSFVSGENRRALELYQSMYWNAGIYVTMPGRSSDENHLHDIVICNNYVHDVLTSGIRVNQQEDFLQDIHHTHVVVRGNRIERTGSDGIIVANCISPLIEGNRCRDAGALGSLEDTKLIAGIWVCGVSNALIQRNEVSGTRLFENDGTAFDTDWGTEGTTVFQYNFTHDNEGGFWLDCMGINRNPHCRGTILRWNISVNDCRCLVQDDYGLPAWLYGNVFINTREGPLLCAHRDGSSHRFSNNYFLFAHAPKKGWLSSAFLGNHYSEGAGLCREDAKADHEIPKELADLWENPPQKMEDCSRLWDMLSLLGPIDTQFFG